MEDWGQSNPVRLDCCCEGLHGEMARTLGGGDLYRGGVERWISLGQSASAQRERPRSLDDSDQATERPVFLTSPGGPAVPPPWPNPGNTSRAFPSSAASACGQSTG